MELIDGRVADNGMQKRQSDNGRSPCCSLRIRLRGRYLNYVIFRKRQIHQC